MPNVCFNYLCSRCFILFTGFKIKNQCLFIYLLYFILLYFIYFIIINIIIIFLLLLLFFFFFFFSHIKMAVILTNIDSIGRLETVLQQIPLAQNF